LRDTAGILSASDRPIDHDYIEHWSEKLGVREAWDTVVRRLGTQ
jgi:hypothetical protein